MKRTPRAKHPTDAPAVLVAAMRKGKRACAANLPRTANPYAGRTSKRRYPLRPWPELAVWWERGWVYVHVRSCEQLELTT